jgi:alkylated DNA repair dioxygenase AlkB
MHGKAPAFGLAPSVLLGECMEQFGLFEGDDSLPQPARLPEGLAYRANIIGTDEERILVARLRRLPFREFEFRGYRGRRRVVSFGWAYDFSRERLQEGDPIPEFLLALREPLGEFAGLPAVSLQQVLVTEYQAGAGIGWHRDKAVFGDVIGLSLLGACTFRLRRRAGTRWERLSLTLEPRSVYLMRGTAREEWEHSIPGVATLRYSVTYRTLVFQV